MIREKTRIKNGYLIFHSFIKNIKCDALWPKYAKPEYNPMRVYPRASRF